MTGVTVTDEMIEAASDEAHRLASDIVLGCYGCGTAAVMIDRALEAHRIAALEEAAKVADEQYRGHGQTLGTARAHNYEHAALLIASQIRNLKGAGA